MFRDDRPGLGRQRGLARGRGRRDVRGLPGLVRDDVLGLLHRAAAACSCFLIVRVRLVRVARASSESSRWRRRLDLGEHDRQRRRAADLGRRASRTCSTACRSTRAATSPAASGISSTRTRVLGGVAVVLLFAFHGATYLTLRTTGELCRRAAAARTAALDRRGRRRRRLPDLDRRGRRRPQRQGRLPARAARRARDRRAARRGRLRAAARRSGWAFVLTAAGDRARRGHDLHQPLSARDGLRAPTSPTASPSTTPSSAHYTLAVMTRGRADRHAGRPALPGLDVLRLPRAAAAATSRPAPVELAGASRPRASLSAPRPAPRCAGRGRRGCCSPLDAALGRGRRAARARAGGAARACGRARVRRGRRSASVLGATRAPRRSPSPARGAPRLGLRGGRPAGRDSDVLSAAAARTRRAAGCATGRPRSTASRAPRSRPRPSHGVDALEAYVRALPAAGRARRRRAGRGPRARVASIDPARRPA